MTIFTKLVLSLALLACGVLSSQAETTKFKDAEIFAIYDQVNGFDIETAELGAVRGHSILVRRLAVMVLRDHSAVRQMARDIAAAASVEYVVDPKSASAADHARTIASLKSLSGEAFDKAYLEHERAFHENAIKAIEGKLSVDAKNERLKAHFEAVLPGFRHHLAETKKALEALVEN